MQSHSIANIVISSNDASKQILDYIIKDHLWAEIVTKTNQHEVCR